MSMKMSETNSIACRLRNLLEFTVEITRNISDILNNITSIDNLVAINYETEVTGNLEINSYIDKLLG